MEYDFPRNELGPWDYVVLAAILALSVSIGIFFGCKRDKTTNAYLMADRGANLFTVAFSMFATFMSSMSLLGIPTEIYTFGTQFLWILLGYVIMTPIIAYVYLPVFYNLKSISMYEYMERRFHRCMRIITAFLFIVLMIFWLAIVVYTPSLAFEVVTGVNMWIMIAVVGCVCIFYTSLGGIKAVLWTDAFQCVIMFAGVIAVVVQGTVDMNGWDKIWQRMLDNNRVQFLEISPNPTVRHTVWGLVIGGTFHWAASYGSNQAQIQRMLCVPTLRKAQASMWINSLGLIFITIVCSMCGMVLNAEYMGCDPLIAGRIQKRDQILPQYVMDRLSYPGLPGLFIGGIFAAALSTISSGLNSLSAVTLCDIIKLIKPNIDDQTSTIISKVLAVVYGGIMILVSYFCDIIPGILQAGYSLFGIISGPLFGVYTLGILFPCANTFGAVSGLTSALGIVIWIVIGGAVISNPNPPPPNVPPHTIANCPLLNASETITPFSSETTWTDSITMAMVTAEASEEASAYLPIYSLSYIWYAMFNTFIVVIVGIVVSLLTGGNKKGVNPELLHGFTRHWNNYKGDIGQEYNDEKPLSKISSPVSNGFTNAVAENENNGRSVTSL